jgi:hypothetical protein
LLKAFEELQGYRGGRPTQLGAALAASLKLLETPLPRNEAATQTEDEAYIDNSVQTENFKDTLPSRDRAAQTDVLEEPSTLTNLNKVAVPTTLLKEETSSHMEDDKLPDTHLLLSAAHADLREGADVPTGVEEPAQTDSEMDADVRCEVEPFHANTNTTAAPSEGAHLQVAAQEATNTGETLRHSNLGMGLLLWRIMRRQPRTAHFEEDPHSGEELERVDPSIWTQFPLYNVRAAIWTQGTLTYGNIKDIFYTINTRLLLYELLFDDGDVIHLTQLEADEAHALALRGTSALSEAAAPIISLSPRTLRRQDADAHLRAVPSAAIGSAPRPKAKAEQTLKRGFLL